MHVDNSCWLQLVGCLPSMLARNEGCHWPGDHGAVGHEFKLQLALALIELVW